VERSKADVKAFVAEDMPENICCPVTQTATL
jgi:hypothetical protein